MVNNQQSSELVFLPVGGCEEIGMNLNAYGFGPPSDRRWMLADIGVTFGDESTPGIDLIMADPEYLIGEQIDAVFLTHAHEDHIGAVGLIYPRLRTDAPIYATPFTAELVRPKLLERGLPDTMLKTVPVGSEIKAGPFEVRYVRLTHSIPEPTALSIKTPHGVVLHTGDWKIDPDPVIGDEIDQAYLSELGDKGVLAMVCDSTNVFEEGEAGSEAVVGQALKDLIKGLKGRVAVTTFASNVARVKSVIEAAEACGRSVCLVGRSMHKVTNAAKEVGLLKGVSDFVEDQDAGSLPDDNLLFLCTGSQGEPRAALSRIARDDHRYIALGEGDTVIFSSRVIPGNEKGIFEMQNALADRGVRIITDRMMEDPIHVSGHPCRDELRKMYQWVRPRISIPVHGERRHTLEHASYAKSLQVAEAVAPKNGDLVRLAPGPAEIIDQVPSGKLALDGDLVVPLTGAGVSERRRLAGAGYLHATVVLDDAAGVLDGPTIIARGLSEPDGSAADESLDALEEAAERALDSLKQKERDDDTAIERAMFRAIRKASEQQFGRRPVIDVTIMRV